MLGSNPLIRCRCGQLQGTLSRAARVTRLSCYCRDCQAYAHALGDPDAVLDSLGGTDVVATLQQHVSFTQGVDQLACLSLTDAGLLRWYARCCNTPIANTARGPGLSYVGLVHNGLAPSPGSLDAAFGPTSLPVNTQHAKGKVPLHAVRVIAATARIMGSVLRARLDGTWKRSPFFAPPEFKPVAPVRVLSAQERERALKAVQA